MCAALFWTRVESVEKCGKVYKHHLRNATKSLQRHVIAKHESMQAVRDEIENTAFRYPR